MWLQFFQNLELSKENYNSSQPKKKLGKNPAFDGYKSPNCPKLSGKIRPKP
jgi:hypothetical protein